MFSGWRFFVGKVWSRRFCEQRAAQGADEGGGYRRLGVWVEALRTPAPGVFIHPSTAVPHGAPALDQPSAPMDQGDRVLPWFPQGVEDVKRRHRGQRTGTGLGEGWAPSQAGGRDS